MSEKIPVTIDGRSVNVENGTMLLGIIREMGIPVPTLCHHDSLTPNGACRLCVVEITHPKWNGWSRLVTSCLYPAEPGLQVSTHSARVRETRRTLLELYLAQCPNSEEVRDLAQQEGVDTTPFPKKEDTDNCVLCGLCTRVCQDLGPAAIVSLGRGTEKVVGPKPDGVGEDCTGCGACAYICPTNAIPIKYENQTLSIWNREFKVPVCSVNPELCRGCGVCEEVCPFSVPRVTVYKTGVAVSQISPSSCVGCGVCVGVCPTNAITQEDVPQLKSIEESLDNKQLEGQAVVFACSRSPLPDDIENTVHVPVSCIAKVSVDTVLDCLARGANGVGLMCRDRDTCPYGKGGTLGEKLVSVNEELAVSAGLGRNRVRLLNPDPGLEGPAQAVSLFRDNLKATPLKAIRESGEEQAAGMDRALDIMQWLKTRPELTPVLPQSVMQIFNTIADSKKTFFYLGNLPEMDLLLSLLISEWRLSDIIENATELLKKKNISVRPVFTKQAVDESNAVKIIAFSRYDLPSFKRDCEIITVNELSGVNSSDTTEVSDFTFFISPEKRRELIEKVKSSSTQLLCSTPQEIAQIRLLLRDGAWREIVTCQPCMAFSTQRDISEEKEKREELPAVRNRIQSHPILTPPADPDSISFTFNGQKISARSGEMISSALYANGIKVFGHHPKDGAPQGIYCANGQCSQCMVIADGKPVKGCMVPVLPGMTVLSCDKKPDLPPEDIVPDMEPAATVDTECLIIGGGPAGLSAAIEMAKFGVKVILVDDKYELGGKLTLQTHNFFGSRIDCYAGTRGIDIAHLLEDELGRYANDMVDIWLNSPAVGVFGDGKVGIVKDGTYVLVKPEILLVAAGAREKTLSFPGCDLPGVYGAGAFQTLVNRDLVRPAEKLFICGGGNVGLIGGYHALQAGIEVVGLVEALPSCGGYKVHLDKLARFGIPVYTSHTILHVQGKEHLEAVTIGEIDSNFKPVTGTEKTFAVDTLLIAVGLSPVDEMYVKAKEYGMNVFAAGDTEEIAEASAAMFSGRIQGRKIARKLKGSVTVQKKWDNLVTTLRSKPGEMVSHDSKTIPGKIYPVFRCVQEIPCNPCRDSCPKNAIKMDTDELIGTPSFEGDTCLGCAQCVLACPGLAVILVDESYDQNGNAALLTMPFELPKGIIHVGEKVITVGMEGEKIGTGTVIAFRDTKKQDRRSLLLLEVPFKDRLRVAGFRIPWNEQEPTKDSVMQDADTIICRCERVTKGEIVTLIRKGYRDMNLIKAALRTGMGACNGKNCTELILRLFREEGVDLKEVTRPVYRPPDIEVPLGIFAGVKE